MLHMKKIEFLEEPMNNLTVIQKRGEIFEL